MSLIKFNSPIDDFFKMSNTLDSFLKNDFFGSQNAASASLPAVNIKETEESFHVELAAPGMKKDDFKIELENNVLRISSEQKEQHEEKDEKGKYSRREFSYQSFQRTFNLPNTIESNSIKAKYEEGILVIDLPKREEAKEKPSRTILID